jgi:hypothetical protein
MTSRALFVLCRRTGRAAGTAVGATALVLASSAMASAHPAASPSWSSTEVHSPATTYFEPVAGLFSVTCAGTGNCLAGGEYVDSAGHDAAMVVPSTKGKWGKAQTVALPHTSYSKFGSGLISGITCTSKGNCVAVGYLGVQQGSPGDGTGFILAEARGKWGKAILPRLPSNATSKPYAQLFSVACADPGTCEAVGYYTTRAVHSGAWALAESRGRWQKPARIPLPSNAVAGGWATLASVQCPAAGDCIAVGSYLTKSDTADGMIATQSRGSWGRAVAVRLPAGGHDADLSSISCVTRSACVAVGDYVVGISTSVPMAVTLSKGKWSSAKTIKVLPANAAAVPNPSLSEVACERSTCQAFGDYLSMSGSQMWMVISETGGHWGPAAQIPLPGNAAAGTTQNIDYPYAASCTSSAWCTAVGTYVLSTGRAESMATTRR